MNAPVQEWTVDNAAWASARPTLSVLIPFLNDDPRRLIAALDAEEIVIGHAVEIVLLDDGTGDDELAHLVIGAVQALKLPARSVRLLANEGRARGRNRLAHHARSEHLLFLDSDMLPDAPDFLRRYLELITTKDPAVAFGGFSLEQAPYDPEHALHRKMAGRSDCAPAKVRRKKPAKYVFTSNLMVRKDLFEAEPFDEGFTGWGWEDVEWGVRVAKAHPILHIDNPATHLGLDPARIIAVKYEQSAANFARILKAHPAVVKAYPSYRVARMMQLLPVLPLWRGLFRSLALAETAPLGLRSFCMRLYRAAACASVI